MCGWYQIPAGLNGLNSTGRMLSKALKALPTIAWRVSCDQRPPPASSRFGRIFQLPSKKNEYVLLEFPSTLFQVR